MGFLSQFKQIFRYYWLMNSLIDLVIVFYFSSIDCVSYNVGNDRWFPAQLLFLLLSGLMHVAAHGEGRPDMESIAGVDMLDVVCVGFWF